MPRLSTFYGIVITMYQRDHPPPHFHARYGEYDARIQIRDGAVLAGWLPRRALRLVRTWRAVHVDELHNAWNRAALRDDPGTIEPLP